MYKILLVCGHEMQMSTFFVLRFLQKSELDNGKFNSVKLIRKNTSTKIYTMLFNESNGNVIN